MPLIGQLVYKLDKDTVVKSGGKVVHILNEDGKRARENLYKAICKRYFNDFMDCKLEDFSVATFCDPRYKQFTFKNFTRWKRGTLTAVSAQAWVRAAYESNNWKPKWLLWNPMVLVGGP
ncbi:hypothetical protein CYMTET_42829 [Cymbomonas tetramitiformis]|uniref:Uncharacterized protein n=1 Tax=Cymbomonas tetramitiformis TaxID=36881 RepID=A0AAE0C3G8_9CHLO|nr:hypothetical protein CYMTET_42829 [Cymbomonas tetramitiformis]